MAGFCLLTEQQMRKSMAGPTVKGITSFLYHGVTNCGFRKLVRYSLNEKSLQYDDEEGLQKINVLSFG